MATRMPPEGAAQQRNSNSASEIGPSPGSPETLVFSAAARSSSSDLGRHSSSGSLDVSALFLQGRARRRAYRTGALLGLGTEGTVKVAVSLETQRRVAIKSVRKQMGSSSSLNSMQSASEEACREVRRKFEVLARLRHPNLLEVIEFFETDEKFYLVTELAAGDLSNLLESREGRKVSEDEARLILQGILKGLTFLHAHGIAHRDLKPQNVLLRTSNDLSTICLADFSGAHVPKQTALLTLDGSPGMKTVVGTPLYLAPCIVNGTGYNEKVDLWSLGCIAYELVFGRTPFSGAGTFIELFSHILAGEWTFPAGDADNVSDRFKDLISKLLVVDSNERLSAAQAAEHPWFTAFWAKERLIELLTGL